MFGKMAITVLLTLMFIVSGPLCLFCFLTSFDSPSSLDDPQAWVVRVLLLGFPLSFLVAIIFAWRSAGKDQPNKY